MAISTIGAMLSENRRVVGTSKSSSGRSSSTTSYEVYGDSLWWQHDVTRCRQY